MAIENIDLSRYRGKTKDGTVFYDEWNELFLVIQTKVNEIIARNSTQSSADFTVNGARMTPVNGVVQLASKGRYVLEGLLEGRVVIGTDADVFDSAVDSPTQVILNNVTIVTDSAENAAIDYVPNDEKMFVTVAKNTVNHLVCTHETPRGDSQKGALHCENDLIVQGSGYLSCINRGGHGIKASELRINGNPHIYVEAVHDGIHGNKLIGITGGKFYINGANDAFGTRAESGTPGTTDYKAPGKIWLFGGEYYAYNILQKVFDSKAQGCIFAHNRVMNTKDNVVNTQATGIVLHTDSTEVNHYAGMECVDPETFFGPGVITGATLQDDGRTYLATGAIVTVKGYFNDISIVCPVKSSEITLDGAYISNTSGHAIEYTYDGKNIKVKASKDTVNIIETAGDSHCIESINNVAIEPKNNAYLVMRSEAESVAGSEITFRDGYGSILCSGVIGSQIIAGEAGSVFGGSIYSPYVTARLSGKGQKGNVTVLDAAFIGVLTTGTLSGAGLNNINGSVHVDYAKAIGSSFVGDSGPAYEPYDFVPYGKATIPFISNI